MKKVIALVLVYIFFSSNAFSAVQYFTDTEAITVILGAAGDESEKEMFAIACALRNREEIEPKKIIEHHIWGDEVKKKYYGVFERFADTSGISKEIKDRAEKAWIKSATSKDITLGATRWTNEPINGNYLRDKPKIPERQTWNNKKNFTVQIGRHRFYKVNA